MVVERIKWILIIALFFIDVVVFYVGYQMGEASVSKTLIDHDIVQEYTGDLPEKCESVRGYAASLEDENSWLVKIWMECDNESR